MLLTKQQKRDAYRAECELLGTIPTYKGFEVFLERWHPYDVQKMLDYGGVKFYKDGEWLVGFPGQFTGFVEYNITLGVMYMLGCTSEDRAVIRSFVENQVMPTIEQLNEKLKILKRAHKKHREIAESNGPDSIHWRCAEEKLKQIEHTSLQLRNLK